MMETWFSTYTATRMAHAFTSAGNACITAFQGLSSQRHSRCFADAALLSPLSYWSLMIFTITASGSSERFWIRWQTSYPH
jgi:hypothetical protein